MTTIISGSNGLTFPDSSTQAVGFYGFKNRIINGAMVVSQYNGTSTFTPSTSGANSYPIDRWFYFPSQASKFTFQQVTSAPSGFGNSLKCLVASAVTVGATDRFNVYQPIEGYNFSDFAFGTASAKTITVSFWVNCSLTGTFSGSFTNYAADRSYPFTYTVNSANTWEQKFVTIPGDTGGTWVGNTNAGAAYLFFSLGCGSNYKGAANTWAGATYLAATGETSLIATAGATLYITGVQLEKGSTATSFDYRPYGTELALCQRYYEKVGFGDASSRYPTVAGYASAASQQTYMSVNFQVYKRSLPTLTKGTASLSNCTDSADGSSYQGFRYIITSSASGAYSGQFVTDGITASAEL
jgi:hypothetical protein